MTKTVTRAGLAAAVSREVGLSNAEAGKIIDFFFDEVALALESGNDVKLPGFGVFSLRDKKSRTGRNPKTGVEVEITPRRVVTFRSSNAIRERMQHE